MQSGLSSDVNYFNSMFPAKIKTVHNELTAFFNLDAYKMIKL